MLTRRLAHWQVLRPPIGMGMLAWTCALPAGAQFVILNTSGYRQMFTVGPSDSESVSSSCWRNATSAITTSSKYGSLDASVYRYLLSWSYTPISIADQFNQVEMPGTIGLDVIQVSLGAAGRNSGKKPSSSSDATPTKTTTGVTTSATRLPQEPDGPPGTTTSPTELSSALPSISHTHSLKTPAGNSPSTPAPLPSATQSRKGGPSRRGFIIDAVLAALALGALLGAFVVIILKRRNKLKSHALASSARGSEAAQVSAFVVLSEGADDRVRNSDKRAADHDELEMGSGDPRTRTAVSEDLPSYRSSVEL